MSTKSVYSIRIPNKYRKMMDDMKDVNWQEEMRAITIQLIQEKAKKRLLKESQEIRNQMKKIDSAKLIREDRDAR
jgi:hypothetical protein